MISFVDSTDSFAHAMTLDLTVPSGVEVGDQIIVVLTEYVPTVTAPYCLNGAMTRLTTYNTGYAGKGVQVFRGIYGTEGSWPDPGDALTFIDDHAIATDWVGVLLVYRADNGFVLNPGCFNQYAESGGTWTFPDYFDAPLGYPAGPYDVIKEGVTTDNWFVYCFGAVLDVPPLPDPLGDLTYPTAPGPGLPPLTAVARGIYGTDAVSPLFSIYVAVADETGATAGYMDFRQWSFATNNNGKTYGVLLEEAPPTPAGQGFIAGFSAF